LKEWVRSFCGRGSYIYCLGLRQRRLRLYIATTHVNNTRLLLLLLLHCGGAMRWLKHLCDQPALVICLKSWIYNYFIVIYVSFILRLTLSIFSLCWLFPAIANDGVKCGSNGELYRTIKILQKILSTVVSHRGWSRHRAAPPLTVQERTGGARYGMPPKKD